MSGVKPSASVAAKAQRLLDEHRVLLATRGGSALVADRAFVGGDHDLYRVEARPGGVVCSCPAGREGRCSHAVAAMVAWAEADQ